MYPGPHYTPFRGCWKMSDLPNGFTGRPGRSPVHPDQIGHYKILEPLGEGGLGVVYLAEQTEPVKRQVALKLIKPGMDSKQVITRFEAERQALAVMEHPNIAQVFDGGVTERGLPYFVMELVRGLPITEYCDTRKLSIHARLDLFIDVCHAVQHAHQKGVIHRDLKPSNILVADSERPVPKVIDFGLAKAMDQRLNEDTVLTQTGYAVGTPAYMSPEQADTTGLDIDTRKDIYSLGVILYELLSGQFPYEQKELEGLAVLYTILERQPPRPSVRYSSLEVTQRSAIANLRATDPGTLRKRLRGDLDWIILKAMEKERDRRYETANSLAMDIERHLREEPVVARPPSAGYRLGKFAKRNKVAVLAGSVAVLALIGGTIAATAGFVAATQRANVAESRGLASSAIRLLNHQPDVALVRAIEAVRRAETYEAGDALRRAVGPHPIAVLRHEGQVYDAAFSLDGERVVTASNQTARLWSARTGEASAVLRHDRPLWTPDGERINQESAVTYAAFSPSGERVVTVSVDQTARLWSAETGEALAVLRGHQGAVKHAAFSPGGERVVTASGDRTARLWSAETGEALAVLRGHAGGVTHAAFSPDGERVVTASRDGARLWSAETGEGLAVLRGQAATHVTFSPDGEEVMTASGTVRLWSAETGQELAVLRHEGQVYYAAYSPDGERVVTVGVDDNMARLWSAETREVLAVLRGHEGIVTHAAFSPGGERVVTASWDRTARLWSAETGRALAVLRGHESEVTHAAFGPGGDRVVTAGSDGTVRLWSTETGEGLALLRGHEGGVTSAAYSPDGDRQVTASWDRTARLWSAEAGEAFAVLRGHEGGVTHAAYSPDGDRVVTASWDRTARLWSAETGEALAVLRHEGQVYHAAFSPSGERVVTTSWDRTARLWSAETGQELAVLRHEESVYHAAFSPGGHRVVTTSGDRTARLWSAETGEALAVLRGHEGGVMHATFSPGGQRVLTASEDGTARIWLVYIGDLLELAESLLPVTLTPDERARMLER